jgi:cytochrome d ubiquinol oxidase subunit II
LTAGYALLGATWLVMKTEGSVAERVRRQAKLLLLVVLGFMAIVSIWTPLAFERIAHRYWFPRRFHFCLLDVFVQPRLAGRWVRDGCGEARRDEARRQGTRTQRHGGS